MVKRRESRIIPEDEAFDQMARLVESPPDPTSALRELMGGRGR